MRHATDLIEHAADSRSPVDIGNYLLEQAGFANSSVTSYEELPGGNPVVAQVFRVSIAGGDSVPQTAIVKIPSTKRTDRVRESAAGSYEREVNAYRLLSPMQGNFQPIVYAALYAPETRTAALLLEDLGGMPERSDFTKEIVADSMRNLAIVHSRFWRNEAIGTQPWMRTRWHADIFKEPIEWFTPNWETISKCERLHPFNSPRVNRMALYLSEHLSEVLDALDCRLTTLTHGDLHTQNMMLRWEVDGHRPVLIDWQDAVYSGATSDVAKFLSTTLTRQEAHDYFDEMLSLYYASLTPAIRAEYDFNQFKRDIMLALLGTFANYVISATTEVPDGSDAERINWSLRRVSAVIDAVDPLSIMSGLK